MPLVYTKEEIKAYLADRGFDVNNESMINKFIHDLKKLVKYEDRGRRRMKLGHDPHETNLDSTGHSAGVHHATDQQEYRDDEAGPSSRRPHDSHRVSSEHGRSEMVDKTDSKVKAAHRHKHDKENVPKHVISRVESRVPVAPSSARIVMTRKTFKQQDGETLVEESFVHIGDASKTKKPRPKTATENNASGKSIVESKEVVNTYRNKKPLNFDSKSRPFGADRTNRTEFSSGAPPSSRLSKISKSSSDIDAQDTDELMYILGNLLEECDDDDEDDDMESVETSKIAKGPPDSVKRDPVALYHYYKGIWDKQKIPGESRHMQLRWNVRAQTVGNYPCINGQPVKYLRSSQRRI